MTCHKFSSSQTASDSSSSQQESSSNQKNESNSDDDKQKKKKSQTSLVVSHDFFSQLKSKEKETFLTAIQMFIDKDKHARGHVEFIYSALRHMKEFGVHRDLDTYKKIVDILPKGRFISQNMWQVEFFHFPKQQQCGIDVLEQMEDFGVIPDSELESMMINIYGTDGFPLRKMRRMLYWMPKFRNLSPWPIPDPLPNDSLALAKLVIEKISSVDVQNKVTVHYSSDLEEPFDENGWIVSAQSPTQERLIEEHPQDAPLYVEGAFRCWIRNACINYFILRAEPKPKPVPKPKDNDDVGLLRGLFSPEYVESNLEVERSVHEQDDGSILALCATSSSSRLSLLSWIRILEKSNKRLGQDIPVLFTLKSPLGPTDTLPTSLWTETGDQTPEIGAQNQGLFQAPGKNSQFFFHNENESEGTKVLEDESMGKEISKEIKSKKEEKKKELNLDMDPNEPQLSQVGVEEGSDTIFVNWPHNRSRRNTTTTSSKRDEFIKGLKKSISNSNENETKEGLR